MSIEQNAKEGLLIRRVEEDGYWIGKDACVSYIFGFLLANVEAFLREFVRDLAKFFVQLLCWRDEFSISISLLPDTHSMTS